MCTVKEGSLAPRFPTGRRSARGEASPEILAQVEGLVRERGIGRPEAVQELHGVGPAELPGGPEARPSHDAGKMKAVVARNPGTTSRTDIRTLRLAQVRLDPGPASPTEQGRVVLEPPVAGVEQEPDGVALGGSVDPRATEVPPTGIAA
jgi:hypothetical protein